MQNLYKTNGKGILLLSVITPFSNAAEIVSEEGAKVGLFVQRFLLPVFKEIYVHDVHDQQGFELLYTV